MEKCTNIINDVIENFKINRTTNAATWLTLILSLVAMWSLNKQTNLNVWIIRILITALVVNFIISATFLVQDEDERRNSELMTGTQVYAICILVAFVGVYALNKETLFEENLAVPVVLLAYLVLLIVSLSQQKNLTTAPVTSAAPPLTSEEIPVDGSSKHKTIQEFSAANIVSIIVALCFLCFFAITYIKPNISDIITEFKEFLKDSLEEFEHMSFFYFEHEKKVAPLLFLLITAITLTTYTFSIQAFFENKDEDKYSFKLQEKASKWSVGLYSFVIAIFIIVSLSRIYYEYGNTFKIIYWQEESSSKGILMAVVAFLELLIITMIPIGITSLPIHFNQRALDYIEENK